MPNLFLESAQSAGLVYAVWSSISPPELGHHRPFIRIAGQVTQGRYISEWLGRLLKENIFQTSWAGYSRKIYYRIAGQVRLSLSS